MERSRAGYLLAVAVVAALTAALKPLGGRVNSTTVALALLLAVLFIAARMESGPALVASVLAMLCFNFFFLPPFGTLHVSEPDNWVALAAFLLTAVIAGQLSARARHRAEEAEVGRLEIKRLYEELRAAFERASHAEALRQSERLKSALLDAVTHDLRTPLTSIKASVSMLLGEARLPARFGRRPRERTRSGRPVGSARSAPFGQTVGRRAVAVGRGRACAAVWLGRPAAAAPFGQMRRARPGWVCGDGIGQTRHAPPASPGLARSDPGRRGRLGVACRRRRGALGAGGGPGRDRSAAGRRGALRRSGGILERSMNKGCAATAGRRR